MANPARDARLKAQIRWPGASVFARGRKFIKHQHPTEPDRYSIDCHIGPIHIEGTETEIDTAWVDNDNPAYAQYRKKMVLADYHAYMGQDTALNFDAANIIKYVHPGSGAELDIFPYPSLVYTNDLEQIQQIGSKQQVPGVIDDDTVRWNGAYGAGLDFIWQTQTARLFKALLIDQRSTLPNPEQFILDGGNPVLKVELQFQKSSGVEIWVDGVLWDEKSNNPQVTVNNVEFRLASTGDVLWYFRFPLAWDEEETIRPLLKIEKRAINLFVKILVPWDWLDSAIYPVVIDVTIDDQVGAGADDASERADDTNFTAIETKVRYDSDTELYDSHWGGTRFDGITVPQGSTIDTGYIEWDVQSPSNDDAYFRLYGEDVDDSANFTDTADLINRTLTTAWVLFQGASLGAGWWGSTIEIKSVIQEITDRASWASGNALTLIGVTLHDAGQQRMRVDSYEYSTTNCAKLHIEYTAGGGGITVVLDTAAVTANGQVLALAPGAVTKALNTASLTAGGQALSLLMGEATTGLNTATLSANGQALSLLMGEATVSLNTALLTAGGQSLTVFVDQIIALNTALLTAGGQALTLAPGTATIDLSTASISAGGQSLSLLMGAVSTGLNTATITANGQQITISLGGGPQTIPLFTATLTAGGQALTLAPGEATVGLNTALLTSDGQVLAVVPGAVTKALSTALLTAAGQPITLAMGEATIILSTATLAANGQVITIVLGGVPQTVVLDTALLTANGQTLTLAPGEVIKALNTALLNANGQAINIVPGAAMVSIDTAALTANGQAISFSMGAVSVGLSTALLTANGQVIAIVVAGGPQTVPLFTATLTANGQALSLAPGAVTIPLDTSLLNADGQSLTVVPGAVSLLLDTGLLTADGQAISLIGVWWSEEVAFIVYIDQARAFTNYIDLAEEFTSYIDQAQEFEVEL